jgi:hypothetical protein
MNKKRGLFTKEETPVHQIYLRGLFFLKPPLSRRFKGLGKNRGHIGGCVIYIAKSVP